MLLVLVRGKWASAMFMPREESMQCEIQGLNNTKKLESALVVQSAANLSQATTTPYVRRLLS
jgi:hypothetical protein